MFSRELRRVLTIIVLKSKNMQDNVREKESPEQKFHNIVHTFIILPSHQEERRVLVARECAELSLSPKEQAMWAERMRRVQYLETLLLAGILDDPDERAYIEREYVYGMNKQSSYDEIRKARTEMTQYRQETSTADFVGAEAREAEGIKRDIIQHETRGVSFQSNALFERQAIQSVFSDSVKYVYDLRIAMRLTKMFVAGKDRWSDQLSQLQKERKKILLATLEKYISQQLRPFIENNGERVSQVYDFGRAHYKAQYDQLLGVQTRSQGAYYQRAWEEKVFPLWLKHREKDSNVLAQRGRESDAKFSSERMILVEEVVAEIEHRIAEDRSSRGRKEKRRSAIQGIQEDGYIQKVLCVTGQEEVDHILRDARILTRSRVPVAE